MKRYILALVLAILAGTMAQAQDKKSAGRTIRLDEKDPYDAVLIKKLKDGAEALEQKVQAQSAKQPRAVVQAITEGASMNGPEQNGTRAAMVVVSGSADDDSGLYLVAVLHTPLPAGSIIARRTRYRDGTAHLEGYQTVVEDLQVEYALGVKLPGGGGYFDGTHQYEFVAFDVSTFKTTADYVSTVTGDGAFIRDSPQLTLNNHLKFGINRGLVDAIVINGKVLPKDSFSVESSPVGPVVNINLFRLPKCIGSGEMPITVVSDGESDTTHARIMISGPQTCKGG